MREKKKVLIADNDTQTVDLIRKILINNDMQAVVVPKDEEAMRQSALSGCDLLLLSIDKQDDESVLQNIEKLRSEGIYIPIILMMESADDVDIILGLNKGADDYLVKPFDPILLSAKIKAILRRNSDFRDQGQHVIHVGPFTLNKRTQCLTKYSEEINLMGKEYQFMQLFLENVNQNITKDMISEVVWKQATPDDHTIMVYINHIRQKIEDDPARPKFIKTVRNIGYRFQYD